MAKVFQKYNPMLTQSYNTNHKAIDIVGNMNGIGALDNILSVGDGVVENIEQNCSRVYSSQNEAIAVYGHSYGCYVLINHGNGLKTRYAHLQYKSNLHLKIGQKISKGDLIGYMGSTGYTNGAHLHFEFIKDGIMIDPYEIIFSNKEIEDYIIKLPDQVTRDESVNQFEVIVSDLNIREGPSVANKVSYFPCPKGIYNVMLIENDWYQIGEKMWINSIGGHFYPKIDSKLSDKRHFSIIHWIKNAISKIIARFKTCLQKNK